MGVSRRHILQILGWGAFFLTSGISLAGFIRFLLPRVLFEKPSRVIIGKPELILGGGDRFRVFVQWKEEHAFWLVRDGRRIYAILARCTHLGCTPNWYPEDQVFACPCHGSRYNKHGVNIAGPAPRPLDRLKIGMDSRGRIYVDMAKTYKYTEFTKKGAYISL